MCDTPTEIELEQSPLSRDVISGLSGNVKTLPSRWFYDDRGSELFEAITRLDEYYLTRAETSILRERQSDIAGFVGSEAVVIEYGAGSGIKTELVLSALRKPHSYVPIDIAGTYLAATSNRIASRFPGLRVRPIERNFLDSFEIPTGIPDGARVGFFPGSTMGNLDAPEAHELLRQMGRHVGDHGRALIGVDLEKDVDTLLRAYDDAAGVTAAFNLNLLRRINDELGADFRLAKFKHTARWNERERAVEMHLVSLCDQVVTVDGQKFTFKPMESIHTESSRKYTIESFRSLARSGGWDVAEAWQDADGLFGLFALERRHAD